MRCRKTTVSYGSTLIDDGHCVRDNKRKKWTAKLYKLIVTPYPALRSFLGRQSVETKF